MSGRALSLGLVAVLFALAGLFHGHAYGEAIFGAEQTPLMAYLAGFCAIQLAIAAVFMIAGRAMAMGAAAMATPARLAGAVIAGVGLTFLVQNVESVVIPAPAPTETPAS
jgi:urease accessory protein